ncbi:hypothetical protein [Taibaiella soli]|uniref:Uncharacterized protein n=1 Tax=Taibaiella soli TaxID=1649169 RepID=A0A2W2B9H2_9BACT|nr:hypothetical protein [Taibaiella soli]PZF72557.1 hypothetical protein DN068_11880 [Taibaiella soli]
MNIKIATALSTLLFCSFTYGKTKSHDTNIRIKSMGSGSGYDTIQFRHRIQDGTSLVICSKDTFCLTNSQYGIIDTRLLQEKFLYVSFGLPGGNGAQNNSQAIFCVSDHHLHLVCPIFNSSVFHSETNELIERHIIQPSVWEQGNQFHLKLHFVDKCTPDTDNSLCERKDMELIFDRKQNIFFQRKVYLDNTYHVSIAGADGDYTKAFKGYFPSMANGKTAYYFAAGNWYELYKEKHLLLRGKASAEKQN